MTKINLSQIKLDPALYPRMGGVSEFNVARLLHAFDTGATFPPLTVEARTKRLVDGWHRHAVYSRKAVKKVDVVEKVYATEADLFADAVRLNIGHGEPLDQHTVHNAIIRLTEFGYSREQIVDVVRLPAETITKIERGFASQEDGKPVALKGGLSHMKGQVLSPQQIAVNRSYSGGKAFFHVRQICELLASDMWPRTDAFNYEMGRLVNLWAELSKKTAA